MCPEKSPVFQRLSLAVQRCGAIALVAFVTLLMAPWALAQSSSSTDSSSSAQAQSGQKPEDTAPEAGGPGGDVGPAIRIFALFVAGSVGLISTCLLQVALGFFLNDWITLLFVVPLIVIFHYGVVLREERYLTAKFGEPYLQYKREVRRWI